MNAIKARPAIIVMGGIALSSTFTNMNVNAQTAATYNKTMKLAVSFSPLLNLLFINEVDAGEDDSYAKYLGYINLLMLLV